MANTARFIKFVVSLVKNNRFNRHIASYKETLTYNEKYREDSALGRIAKYKSFVLIGLLSSVPAMSAAESARAPAAEGASVPVDAAARCGALAHSNRFAAFTVKSAALVTNGSGMPLPPFCEVVAQASPAPGSQIGMVFRLPINWNGKMLGLGGGGFAGNVTLMAALPGLARGYATFQTDTGHPSAMPWDTAWAVNPNGTPNTESLIDFGFRAVHETTQNAKTAVKAFYGSAQQYTYFQGCSQGGRQAIVASQRYPADFDGIIAGAPAFSDGARVSMSMISRAFRAPESKLSRPQIKLVNSAVLRACDGKDGAVDGIIDNPAQCNWDPAELSCKAGASGDSCLSAQRVTAVRSAYANHSGPDGKVIAYGLPRGSELSSFPWFIGLKQDSQVETGYVNFAPAAGFQRDTDWNSNDVLASHEAQKNSLFDLIYYAENLDISRFANRGGKLLIWQGMYDQLLPPWAFFDYYDAMRRVTAVQLASSGDKTRVEDAAQLFTAVGVAHCMGGPGPSDFDGLTALENWVEKGEKPTRLIAKAASPQMVSMAASFFNDVPNDRPLPNSRPMCPWPTLPHYNGRGDGAGAAIPPRNQTRDKRRGGEGMKNIVKIKMALLASGAFAASAVVAQAQEAGSRAGASEIEEIVVTAQKREQKIDDVPISITALGGDALRDRGIVSTADLVKAVPGFTVTQTNSLTPVYTLRGVGLSLYDAGVGAAPSVSLYVDEVPLPSPMPVAASTLDLERVEVLKGPQGTLFGQNATGGAINHVSAKPTDHLAAGGSVSFARFGKIDATAYLSGPLSETLAARVAVRAVVGGAWQSSVTRPGDELGDSRELQGRLLLDWTPSEKAHFLLTVSGARDRSDTMAGQFVAATPSVPVLAVPALLATAAAPQTPRAADWSIGVDQRSNDTYFHVGLRSEFELSDAITLTSLTNYQHVKIDKMVDQDGSAALVLQIDPYGYAKTFDQELRISGGGDRLTWVVGGNYEHSRISDNLLYSETHLSFNGVFSGPPFFIPPYNQVLSTTEQKVETYAVFANTEYKLTDNLTAQAGIRYTGAKRSSVSCTSDPESPDYLSQFINAYQLASLGSGAKTTPFVPIAPNACIILTPPPELSPTGPLNLSLDEDNVSWRVGLSYQGNGGTLLYGNISRGYKAGAIIPSGGLLVGSYLPTRQESLLAYEIGLKAPLLNNRVQVNVAGFFYDYKDKQVPATVADPIFVALPGLGNVPKSRVYGVEGQLIARPVDGLSLNLAATYLNTKINSDFFTTVIQGGVPTPVNARGLELPNTPDFSATADAEYEWGVGTGINAFLGGGLTHVAKTTASFPANGIATILPSYTLLDLRAGVASPDGRWRAQIWGRNVTNKYYIVTDTSGVDSRYRFTGMPATYGITLSFSM